MVFYIHRKNFIIKLSKFQLLFVGLYGSLAHFVEYFMKISKELMAVLNRTNIVATPQKELKEGVLFELESTNALFFLSEQTRKDISRKRLGWCLSFLQIDSDAAEKAVDDASLY